MKLETLQDELKADLLLDQTKLQLEAANNPVLYCKWMKKHSDIRKEILRIEASRKRKLKMKLDYYSGRGDEVSLDRYERSEMKTVLAGDEEILKTETSLEYWTILLEFCSQALDAIKSRGFAIKHICDMRAFEAGK